MNSMVAYGMDVGSATLPVDVLLGVPKMRYDQTIKREAMLEKMDYNLITIWECEYRKLKKENPDSFANLEIFPEPLKPRDAFFGGRTTAFIRLHDTVGSEKIMYKDFTSLYPWVNKNSLYPVGHPVTYVGSERCPDVRDVCGIVKCRVLPPKQLYFPVLPCHGPDGKLMFALCKTCVDEQNQDTCTHNDEERAMTGTWVSPELQVALDRGYKILKVYEIWDYPEKTQYDPATGTGGLFAGYVDTFVKGKTEASGWPPHCITEEDKERYVREFFEAEGVRLDPTNIEENSGLRSIFKSLLNNFWVSWIIN